MRRFGWVWMAVVVACGGGGGAAGDAADAMARDAPADAITLPFLEAYDKAWEEPDAAARRRLLEYSAVEGLIVYEPTRTLGSREAVYTAMTDFVTSYPGGSVPLVGNVREMHERVWLRWDVLTGNGTSLAMGLDLMKRASDMRLERVNSFYGTLPAVGTNTTVQQALVDAWNQADAGQRTTLLDTAVTDDVVVAIEGEPAIITGRAAFSALIGSRLTASPGQQLSLTTGYLTMPQAFHVAWTVVASDGTTTLGGGVMMALLAADGRVAEAVYFNGTVP